MECVNKNSKRGSRPVEELKSLCSSCPPPSPHEMQTLTSWKHFISCKTEKIPPLCTFLNQTAPLFFADIPLVYSLVFTVWSLTCGMSCPDILLQQEAHHVTDVKIRRTWIASYFVVYFQLVSLCLIYRVFVCFIRRNLCAEGMRKRPRTRDLSALRARADVHRALQRDEPLSALHTLPLR